MEEQAHGGVRKKMLLLALSSFVLGYCVDSIFTFYVNVSTITPTTTTRNETTLVFDFSSVNPREGTTSTMDASAAAAEAKAASSIHEYLQDFLRIQKTTYPQLRSTNSDNARCKPMNDDIAFPTLPHDDLEFLLSSSSLTKNNNNDIQQQEESFITTLSCIVGDSLPPS